MKKKIVAVFLAFTLIVPRPAKADLFGGDGVPGNARV